MEVPTTGEVLIGRTIWDGVPDKDPLGLDIVHLSPLFIEVPPFQDHPFSLLSFPTLVPPFAPGLVRAETFETFSNLK